MGASWLTTVFGALVILGDIGAFIGNFTKENPTPIGMQGWFTYGTGLAMGIGLILSKSFNVSNAPAPVAATVVPAVAAATPNPSATINV